MRSTTSPYIKITKSDIHHKGIFAKKDIPEGTRIIEYVGERITKAETNRRADIPLELSKKDVTMGAVYIFELNKRHDIDGNVSWNTARFINHSCDPNCETDIIRGKIWVIALRDIKKGEEITYNYGYDFDSWDEHECNCRTVKCIGYILSEDHWPRLKRTLEKKKNGHLKKKVNAKKQANRKAARKAKRY